MLYPGSLMIWTSLALYWPQLAGGDVTDNISCSQSTLSYNKTGLNLDVTCDLRVNFQYDRCIWERKRSNGTTERVAGKRLLATNSKINNTCPVSVPLSNRSTIGTSPETPLFTLDVYFESYANRRITKNMKVHFTLPRVNAGKCQLSHSSTTAAGTCKQLAFGNQFRRTNNRLEEHMCTTNVLDTGKSFRGISFNLEREHGCPQRDASMKSIFDVDMQYVKSLALLTISASGLRDIRVGKTYTQGSEWFRFDLSFTRPGQSDRQADRQTVAIRFLFQRHNLEPLLVECVRPVTDCQKPAVLTRSTRRTTGRTRNGNRSRTNASTTTTTTSTWNRNRPRTNTTTTTTTTTSHVQKLPDNNSKTHAVTIVAAILGGLLIILLVIIAVVVIYVRRKKLRKEREARQSVCPIVSHEEENTDMIENDLYVERRQLHGSCEMIANDLYRSQENMCDDEPVPGMRAECHMTVQDNPNTGANHCVTGSFGSDDGNLPAEDNPTEAMLYSTINDSTSTDNT